MPRALLLVLLLSLGPAWAAPVPFPKPKKKPAVLDLAGTTWVGNGIVATPTTYTFEPGGVLAYSYNNRRYRNGTWKQTGNQVYWEANGKFCEFDGTFEGNRMTGRVWNVRGNMANLMMTRQP